MRAPRPHTPRLSLHSLHPAGIRLPYFFIFILFFPLKSMRAPRPHTPRLSLHSLHPAGIRLPYFFIFPLSGNQKWCQEKRDWVQLSEA